MNPVLAWCWVSVGDGWPTSRQHWITVCAGWIYFVNLQRLLNNLFARNKKTHIFFNVFTCVFNHCSSLNRFRSSSVHVLDLQGFLVFKGCWLAAGSTRSSLVLTVLFFPRGSVITKKMFCLWRKRIASVAACPSFFSLTHQVPGSMFPSRWMCYSARLWNQPVCALPGADSDTKKYLFEQSTSLVDCSNKYFCIWDFIYSNSAPQYYKFFLFRRIYV